MEQTNKKKKTIIKQAREEEDKPEKEKREQEKREEVKIVREEEKLSEEKINQKNSLISLKERSPLSQKCEVENEPIKPEMALPAQCEIEEEGKENNSDKTISKSDPKISEKKVCFGRFCFLPGKAFWLGVLFGIAIMSFLVIICWILFWTKFDYLINNLLS
jgi:hypothetical protein